MRRGPRLRRRSRYQVPRRLTAWPAELTGDLDELRLEVGAVDDLRGVWAHAAGMARARAIDVRVRSWKPPVTGWVGRPGALPGVCARSVVVGDDGSVTVRLETTRPTDAGRAVAAVLAALTPHRPDHAPGSGDVGVAVPLGGIGSELVLRAHDVIPMSEHANDHVRRTDVLVRPAGAVSAAAEVASRTQVEVGRRTLAVIDHAGSRARATRLVDSTIHNPVGRSTVGSRAVLEQDEQGRLVVVGESLRRVIDRSGPDARDVRALRRVGSAVVGPGVAADQHLTSLLALMASGLALSLAPGAPSPAVPERIRTLWSAADTADEIRTWVTSVQQRRAVLRHHSTESVLRHVQSAHDGTPSAPSVSVILSTMRPDRLERVVGMVAAFDYPRVQLLVGVHGDGADVEAARRAVAAHPRLDSVVLHRSSEIAFGAVLADLSARADGTLVTKIDDDDDYGSQHLWDLVLARDFSGAAVVGKPPEFVYLEDLDLTVRRGGYRVEKYGPFVAGGTMLISRADLDAVGGWRPVARSVDRGLLERVLRDGGLVYSTHGLGYVYVRHSAGHTWDPGLDHFLTKNLAQWPGRVADPDLLTFPEPARSDLSRSE